MKWNWEKLCGRNNSEFTVWSNNDFGHCFELLIFVCVSHIFLAVTSAYHFSRHQRRRIQGRIPHSPTLHIRVIIAVFMVLSPLLLIGLTLLYLKLHPSLIDIISWVLRALTWLIHSSFLQRLKRLHHIHIRGPTIVVLSFFLTTASLIIELRTVILHRSSGTGYISIVEEVITYVMGALHTIYILTLIPWRRPAYSGGHRDAEGINRIVGDHSLLRGEPGVNEAPHGTVPSQVTPIILGVAQDNSNCFSKLFFWWVQPLMVKGSKGSIGNGSDLFLLPNQLGTQFVDDKFKATYAAWHSDNCIRNEGSMDALQAEGASADIAVMIKNGSSSSRSQQRKLADEKQQITLLSALNKTFGLEFYSLGILKFLGDGLAFAGPILLNYLVSYMEDKNEPDWHGYLYAGLLCISTFFSSLFATHFDYLINLTGMKIRTALITAVYRKTLSVSSVSLSKFSSGEVVNFMSTDTDRIVNFCPSFHQFWSLPVQVAISLYLLYSQVGLAFLAGLGFVLIIIPINKWIANKIGELSTDMMEQKDGRVKVMTEILYGIRVIKYYAWEPHFTKRINILRAAELNSLKGRKYLDALCVFFWASTPVLISILTFMTYSLMGNQLTAAKVFTSMALFNMLIMPLNAFPWVLNGLVEAWVSVKRVQNFMMLPEVDLEEYYSDMHTETVGGEEPAMEINISSGCFSWTTEPLSQINCSRPSNIDVSGSIGPDGQEEDSLLESTTSKTLRLCDIDISILKGQLIGVIGKVGSGKSSLLSAITADMCKERGEISVTSLATGFGLAAQEAWIQHASLRENILFGKPYEQKRYNQVIEACALIDDLKVLPAGDQTEIGENGVTLSGGQKARVSLARAVYQDKEVYLMDDPLAAVDAHVARHLFDKCIMGLLRDKTRILCTHHVNYLQDADLVLLMENGTILRAGSPQDIINSAQLETKYGRQRSERTTSESDVGQASSCITGEGTLVTEEEKDTGVVKAHVYMAYWRAVGKCLAPLVLIALFLMQASRNLSDWWLSYWVTHSHHHLSHHNSSDSFLLASIPDYMYRSSMILPSVPTPWSNITESEDNVKFYLTVFGIIAACNTIFTCARAFLFAYGGLCAATVVHEKLLGSMLRAPIGFFDVTPIGRVVNRFSSDQYSVDDSLPFILNIFLAQLYGVLGTLVITCYGLPWFALMLVPLGIYYYFVQKYYRQTSREIKRITSITLSPIYAHFSETINGLSTIKALRETDRFLKENQERLEMNQRAVFCGKAASKWLAIRLQMMGVAMVTGVALIAVLEHRFQAVNAGLVGLAISYALSVTSLLNGVVVWFTETEMQMVSMERASQYTHDVPQEKDWSVLNAPPYWPIQGAVSFQHVCLQYRPSLPLALKSVIFETQPAEKIGIVGRTGSGKSSLFLTLFRMVEIQSGQIFIDGINVSHLPLNELRSRLAIIPQDPFLFSGSVRDNLDPTSTYSEGEMWMALERCHLSSVVCTLGGLDAEVAERGRHFSVGQRQLMCLARALLTRAKVLCIDEATASVDQETDFLIQQTIREEFRNDTVLTIAHRINTILDSDRVLVMHEGSVAEFDKPATLLEKPNSMFYELVYGHST